MSRRSEARETAVAYAIFVVVVLGALLGWVLQGLRELTVRWEQRH